MAFMNINAGKSVAKDNKAIMDIKPLALQKID